jgi:hypothetical protein
MRFLGTTSTVRTLLITLAALVLWIGFHVPSIRYGTHDTPLHVSYLTADEQSPVNGALHVLQSKSIFGLQNQTTLYYGPIFAMLAVPGVILDFGYRYLTGEITQPLEYKNVVVWDWGGILVWVRVTAVLVGFLGLIALWLLFRTRTCNPSGDVRMSWIAAGLLATNYLYVEYSGTFRHWIFMVVLVLWQLVCAVWILEAKTGRIRLWVGQVVLATCTFGISYVGLLYQLFWVPILYQWWRESAWQQLREFGYYVAGALGGMALMVWWHPYGFMRTFGLFRFVSDAPSSSAAIVEASRLSAITDAFAYYIQVIVVNNSVLTLVGVLCAVLVVRGVGRRTCVHFGLIPLIPAIANLLFFSVHAHTESRHMLPTTVLLLVAVLIGCAHAVPYIVAQRRFVHMSKILVLIACGLGILQSGGLMRVMSYGPPERALILPQIHAWQQENLHTKVLLVKNWPLGYVHTHDAYTEYVDRYNKGAYELWQYIASTPTPEEVRPINVYYRHDTESWTEEDLSAYDHVVVYHAPRKVEGIAPESPLDVYDLMPWTLWNFTDYQESYTVVR